VHSQGYSGTATLYACRVGDNNDAYSDTRHDSQADPGGCLGPLCPYGDSKYTTMGQEIRKLTKTMEDSQCPVLRKDDPFPGWAALSEKNETLADVTGGLYRACAPESRVKNGAAHPCMTAPNVSPSIPGLHSMLLHGKGGACNGH